MSLQYARPFAGALLACSALVAACSDATQIELLEIPGSGAVAGVAFLDLDFTGTFSPGDEPVSGISVELLAGSSTVVAGSAVTDSIGIFTIDEIPTGDYRVRFAEGVVGDTLEAVGADSTISVITGDTAIVSIGANYPTVSLAEALATPAGRTVFTSGIALNRRVPFDSTGRVHITAGGVALRALAVERSGISAGDSVRFLGRTIIDNGRPALSDVSAAVLIPSAASVDPFDLSTADAASAQDSVLDAALIRVQDAEISDTTTTAEGDFHFWLDDGSDSVEVVIRDFLGVDPTAIRPDTTVRVSELTGLLTPVQDGGGQITWQILPRDGSDITLETKFANLGLTLTADTTAAELGDTITFTVVVTNTGPLTATGVTVVDSIPPQTAFAGSTESSGSYDSAAGLWTVGDLLAGAADTLQLQVEVTDATPGQIENRAFTGQLVFEVDPDPSDNVRGILITIS